MNLVMDRTKSSSKSLQMQTQAIFRNCVRVAEHNVEPQRALTILSHSHNEYIN